MNAYLCWVPSRARFADATTILAKDATRAFEVYARSAKASKEGLVVAVAIMTSPECLFLWKVTATAAFRSLGSPSREETQEACARIAADESYPARHTCRHCGVAIIARSAVGLPEAPSCFGCAEGARDTEPAPAPPVREDRAGGYCARHMDPRNFAPELVAALDELVTLACMRWPTSPTDLLRLNAAVSDHGPCTIVPHLDAVEAIANGSIWPTGLLCDRHGHEIGLVVEQPIMTVSPHR